MTTHMFSIDNTNATDAKFGVHIVINHPCTNIYTTWPELETKFVHVCFGDSEIKFPEKEFFGMLDVIKSKFEEAPYCG